LFGCVEENVPCRLEWKHENMRTHENQHFHQTKSACHVVFLKEPSALFAESGLFTVPKSNASNNGWRLSGVAANGNSWSGSK
jgi:hypothetical protein